MRASMPGGGRDKERGSGFSRSAGRVSDALGNPFPPPALLQEALFGAQARSIVTRDGGEVGGSAQGPNAGAGRPVEVRASRGFRAGHV